jgi:2-polyprenyl-6-hydroxyphenyl methylase/3-demethylubiquinone-9 3-methyltransferase
MRAPGDYPNGKEGDALTVEFTVCGIPCIGLNGGPEFKHNEAFSFQIATDDQAETDRLWNAIVGNRRTGKRVRMVQRQVGPELADHGHAPSSRRSQTPIAQPPSVRSKQ